MKSGAFAMAMAASTGMALANPTRSDEQQPDKVKRASIPTVTTKGNAFFAGNNRFLIRGIDYQPGGSSAAKDPLADETVCKRDIAEFSKLQINTVRVYIVDNSANHDTCMNALADAGIYVILDVNNPLYSINSADPGPSYNTEYLQSVFATIDAFQSYDNTLAFFSGNEVITATTDTTRAAPYVKAATRDMRQYIRARGYRNIPVGYSAADVSQNRMQLADYMNCGTEDERSDFFAFNDYAYCNTDFVTSGWDQKVKNFTGYGIPIFLSEYGCITNDRSFSELGSLMSGNMTSVYSGGLMYEYAMEDNGYGIVTSASYDAPAVSELAGFSNFSTALAKWTQMSGDGGYTSTTNSASCPTSDSDWLVDSTLLPAIPVDALAYMTKGAGTGPGLKGSGSQNAGGTSTGNASPGSGSGIPAATGKSKSGASPAAMGAFDMKPVFLTGLAFCLTMVGTLAL
jgi:hypothetical protein